MEENVRKAVDGHAHLDEVPDVDAALARAKSAGVMAVVGVGMDGASNRRILDIARRYPGYVFPAIGLHPWNIQPESLDEDLEFIEQHLGSCVALGEVGLDYKTRTPKRLQKETLHRLLELAVRMDKPAITHSRYSHQTTFDMVREHGVRTAVFHWYSGPLDLLDRIVDHGYFISATPALSYSPPHRDAVRRIPLEHLLLETDCPVRYGDLESRPEHVMETLRLVASLRDRDPAEIGAIALENARRAFPVLYTEQEVGSD